MMGLPAPVGNDGVDGDGAIDGDDEVDRQLWDRCVGQRQVSIQRERERVGIWVLYLGER